MTEPRAERTLVKSPPELWAEVSDAEALGRHLEDFGPIRITRLDPETTVAWEGDRVRGTVELAGSGWGTKVILTAAGEEPAPAAPPTPERPISTPGRRGGLLTFFRRQPRGIEPEPAPVVVASEPTPDIEAVLTGVLDDLGSAQKRPFSR